MSDDAARAEKIALARKKLKNFEVQRAVCSPESRSSLNTGDGRHSSLSVSSQQDSNSLNSFMVVNENNSKKNSEVSLSTNEASNGVNQGSSSPYLNVLEEKNEAVRAYESAKQQLEELQSHYSQLHAAYSQIAASGVHSDVEKQVIQLQAALTMVIEEKTNLQLELREARQKIEESKPLPIANSFVADESVLRDLRKEIDNRERLLVARGVELETQRTKAAEAQATLLTVQHERSEAKARLKAVFRERDALEVELKASRKECSMKDIHLKQMSAHTNVAVESNANVVELNAQLDALTKEVSTLRDQKNEMQMDFDSSKKRFDGFSTELRGNLQQAEYKLEQVLSENYQYKQNIINLEEQLRAARETVIVDNAVPSEPLDDNSQKEIEEQNVAIRKLENRLRQIASEHESVVLEKDKLLFEREQAISETLLRCRHLEDRISDMPAVSPDLISLSEQLQNEKATVSRAVAQNKELKEQLFETEDRLVALTEEKLQSELGRQNAEHQVKELNRRISLLEAGLISPGPSPTLEAVVHPSLNLEPVQQERSDDDYSHTCRESELEQEIVSVREQLSAVVGQLRRSEHRNEEINQILMLNAQDENQNSFHVELGQAVNRVQELNSENETLRNTVAQMEAAQSDLLSRIESFENQETEEAEEVMEESEIKQEIQVESNVGSMEWARHELEKRFEKVIRQNAELMESMDRLEHVNLQLQLENDTIADHVVLYQHQRRLIRERLKVKDQQLASLEAERLRVSGRCAELQEALMSLIETSKVESTAKEIPESFARRVSRTYSHSTIDELSGDEDVIVSSKDELSPSPVSKHEDVEDIQSSTENGTFYASDKDVAVQKILNLIEDIRLPSPITSGEKLHCTQCIGDLKDL